MVAPALIPRTAPAVGDRSAQPQARRPPGRGSRPALNLGQEDPETVEVLAWSDLDAVAPLLEALDRIRTIEPGRPGESEEAKVLRARRAYHESSTERRARLESGLD